MPVTEFGPQQLTALRRRLLAWFDRSRRDLPWRRDRDPYRIWVSEVMLQQTTVAAIVPRFERFLKRFPSLRDLADADEQDVLKEWEGLGYYRRARDLHKAARRLAEAHGGALPDDPAVWAELPGVGRYILGAVLSQAFDRRLPIVEANSKRVLCRLFGERGDPASGPVSAWLWRAAERLLPRKRAGDFNQALMELGALICTPAAPRCGACPAAAVCTANREGLQDVIPTKSPPPEVVAVPEVAVVVRKGARVLLARRPETGRWANMWEFPHTTVEGKERHERAARRLLKSGLGIEADLGGEVLIVRHAVTRFRITMVCLEAIYRSGTLAPTHYREARWLRPQELAAYPVSVPQRQLAEEVARASRQLRLF
jgi:A/G-specific adenine glycosylase